MKSLLLGAFISVWMLMVNVAIADTAAEKIVVKTPHIEVVSTGKNSAEVFMELDNHSDGAITLVAANSPVATQAQLHTTLEHGSMKQVKSIMVPAQSDEELQLGSFHVMLLGLKQALHAKDIVPILLIFSDGSSITVHAIVS